MAILDMIKPYTDKLAEVSSMLDAHTIILSDLLQKKTMQTVFNWLIIMWPALLIALDRWLFR
jgi:hypothetical protein